MPITVDCPSCGQKLKVPDHLEGKKVKCSKCQGTFTATPQEAPPPPKLSKSKQGNAPPPPDDEFDDDRPSRRGSRGGEGGYKSGRGGMLLTFGIISIAAALASFICWIIPFVGYCTPLFTILGLVFGIMAWVMGSGDLKEIKSGRMDPLAKGSTQGGFITGIIGTLLNLAALLCGCIAIIVVFAFFGGLAVLGPPGKPAGNNPPFRPAPGRFVVPGSPLKMADYMPTGGSLTPGR